MRDTILLVDDDKGFLTVFSRILAKKGFSVITATNATGAKDLVGEDTIDTTVLDISLPDADGTELLQQLLQICPDLPVIMLTGHSSIQNAIRSLNNGAFAYLEKPVDPDHLISVITRALEKRRLQRENQRLLKELEKRHSETRILLSLSQKIFHSLDLNEIIRLTLNELTETLKLRAIALYLRENGSLKLKGHIGWQNFEIPDIFPTENLVNFGKEKSLLHVKDSKEFLPDSYCTKQQKDPLILISLGISENYSGLLILCPGENNQQTSSDELLAGIGREVFLAINNAQLYEEASSARALRELDSLRTELLANVSHELRTPLAAIKGYASALLQPDVTFDAETRNEFLQTIDKEADKLAKLISNLLTMSRLDAGTLEVVKKPRKLCEIVDNIKDNLINLTTKHRLIISIPQDLPVIMVDDQISAVFTNLVENAVKYSPAGSSINLQAQVDGDNILVSVRDEGIGIPPEYKEKIFERFYQISDPKTGHKPGTGLGLSICRGIITAHGGRIWVESKPGQGSTFFFTLPISKGDSQNE